MFDAIGAPVRIRLTICCLGGLAALGLSGCTTAAVDQDVLNTAGLIEPDVAAAPPWWDETGDALLARLVGNGLYADPMIACDAAFVASRMNGGGRDPARAFELRVLALSHAHRRAERVRDIALAYIEVRRLQERIAMRAERLARFEDNAQIAEFRRQAGLVPALDGVLARNVTGVIGSDSGADSAKLDRAIGDLARLSATDRATLVEQLGESGTVPTFSSIPQPDAALHRADLLALQSTNEERTAQYRAEKRGKSAADRDGAAAVAIPVPGYDAPAKAEESIRSAIAAERALLNAIDARSKELADASGRARRAITDARLAYRMGMGSYADLYVAEGAGLGIDETNLALRAEKASTIARLWFEQGAGWSAADLFSTGGTSACG